MLFREFMKEKQNIDAEVQRQYEEIRRETHEHEEKLKKEREEFDKLMDQKNSALEIITGIMNYATGILTGNTYNLCTLEELNEKAQKHKMLCNDDEFIGALEQIKTGNQKGTIEGIQVMAKLCTKYATLNAKYI